MTTIFGVPQLQKATAGSFAPIPSQHLTKGNLAKAIQERIWPGTYVSAADIARGTHGEWNWGQNAGESFCWTPRQSRQCRYVILRDTVEVWQERKTNVALPTIAAYTLLDRRKLERNDLDTLYHVEGPEFPYPGYPITAAASVLISFAVLATQRILCISKACYKDHLDLVTITPGYKTMQVSSNYRDPIAIVFYQFRKINDTQFRGNV